MGLPCTLVINSYVRIVFSKFIYLFLFIFWLHKITLNEASTISSYSHSYIRNLLCCPVNKSWMLFIPYSTGIMFLTMAKVNANFTIFSAAICSSYTKIHYQEIPSIGSNVLELFLCLYTQPVPLYSFCPIFIKSFQ